MLLHSQVNVTIQP